MIYFQHLTGFFFILNIQLKDDRKMLPTCPYTAIFAQFLKKQEVRDILNMFKALNNNSTNNSLFKNDEEFKDHTIITVKFTEIEILMYTLSFIILFIIGLILNIFLLYLFIRKKKIRDGLIKFVPLVTINDVVMGLWELEQLLVLKYINLEKLPPPLCTALNCIGSTLYIQSQYYLLFIFISRYMKINNPFNHKEYLTIPRLIIILISVFILSAVTSLIPMFLSVSNYTGEGNCQGWYNYKTHYLPINFLFFLPISVGVLYFHIKIMKIAKKHANSMEVQMKQIKNISAASKANLIQLLLTIIIWVFFCLGLTLLILNDKRVKAQKLIFCISQIVLSQTVYNPLFTVFGNVSLKFEFYRFFRLKNQNISPII